ncbi:CBS domain-containing protein [Deinococcus pimensis]|uniref:CBS domain-containing protein n=1 Tax=Deinococcus pimensis TaxID=309888 RepID=UPI0004817183|nr:CBS domain-containing protein [Deinococcus pimensis]
MKVRDVMTSAVVTVEETAPAGEARDTLLRTGLHVLPVVRGGRLVGLVVGQALPTPLDGKRVADVMRPPELRLRPTATLEQVAGLMLESGVNGLPVTSADATLLGVVTVRDLLEVLVRAPRPGFSG